MPTLTFTAAGRKRKLSRETPSGPFIIRFQVDGKEMHRSLGTTCAAAAKVKAKSIIEAEINGDVEMSRRLKVRSGYCTLKQVCDIYVEKFGTNKRRKRSARGNVGCLTKIVRTVLTRTLEAAKSDVLTGKLIEQFEAVELRKIKRGTGGHMDQQSEFRVRGSLCSVVHQARSIFKTETINWFADLTLPDLTSFRQQGITAPPKRRPQPLDEGVIDQINEAAPALRAANPACYLSHLLFKYLGMRNIEQKAAKWTWVRLTPELRPLGIAAKLYVIFRPEQQFEPKGNEGSIPISPWVLAELQALRKESPDGDFIVPALHQTDREKIIDDLHSAWAGQWIKNRSKVSYELRRYAGSLLYKQTKNIQYVQQFLRHSDVKTTMDWYWYLLEEVPAIDPGMGAPALSIVA